MVGDITSALKCDVKIVLVQTIKLLKGWGEWEWNCSSFLIFHCGAECQFQNPIRFVL